MLVSGGHFSENHTDLGVRWTFVLYTPDASSWLHYEIPSSILTPILHPNLGHVSSLNILWLNMLPAWSTIHFFLRSNSIFSAVWVGFPKTASQAEADKAKKKKFHLTFYFYPKAYKMVSRYSHFVQTRWNRSYNKSSFGSAPCGLLWGWSPS